VVSFAQEGAVPGELCSAFQEFLGKIHSRCEDLVEYKKQIYTKGGKCMLFYVC